MVQGQLKDNPDINPTVGLLALEELSAIDRYHQECVIWFNDTVTKGMDIGATTENVIIGINETIIDAKILQYLLSPVLAVMHLPSSLRMSPESL